MAKRKDWLIRNGELIVKPSFHRKRKLWDAALETLYKERWSVLEPKYYDPPRPINQRLLRHLEREIDWYELKSYEVSHQWHLLQMRKMNRLIRKWQRQQGLASTEADGCAIGGE